MWELMQANKRKSLFLFMGMGIFLLALGYVVGEVFSPGGGFFGLAIAAVVWLVQSLVSYAWGSKILLMSSKAQPVTHEVHPQLFNIVEEMKIAANLPAMPKIYIIPDPAPNAFATGIKPENSAIAVTAGLLGRLNRDELQGVIAHEMSHIINRDVMFMTFAGVLLGSIVLISQVFLRGMFYSGGGRRYRSGSNRGQGQAQAVIMIVAVILAILAPILAQLLYFAISRKREYLADASAVRLTRYPEGLASALESISNSDYKPAVVNKVTAPMYIANPLEKGRKLSSLTSTHPPIKERVKILRNMAQGANFTAYEKSFEQVAGEEIIPKSQLQNDKTVSIRQAKDRKKTGNKKKDLRQVGDLIRTVNKYAFLACACGLKMKIPPNFKKPTIICPRCHREHKVPLAELAAMTATATKN